VSATVEITLDATDVEAAVAFWRAALGYERLYDRDPFVVLGPPPGDTRPSVLIQRVDRVTADKSPVHLDLRSDDPDAEVARLIALGATIQYQVDDRARGGGRWTTLTDPQGTVFCVAPARLTTPSG
jgi:predicted enzyme related to lactoylglutathione lyase